MEPRTEEGHFEKLGLCPGGKFPNHGPQKQLCLLIDSATALFGFSPATSIICLRTWPESCLSVPQITGLLSSALAVDHEVAVTSLQPLLASSPPAQELGRRCA